MGSTQDPDNDPDEQRVAELASIDQDLDAEQAALERLWHDDTVGMVWFGEDDAWLDKRIDWVAEGEPGARTHQRGATCRWCGSSLIGRNNTCPCSWDHPKPVTNYHCGIKQPERPASCYFG